MSLRWRIAIALGVLAALATATVGFTSYFATRTRLYDEIDDSLAQATALVVAPVRGGRVAPRVPGLLSQFTVQHVDADGGVVTAGEVDLPIDDVARDRAATEGPPVLRTVSVDGTPYRIETVSLPRGGAVQVARDLSETERVLEALRRRTALIGAVVVAVAAVAGWLIAAGVTRSLRRLAGAADEVADTGRLDVSVPIVGDDEVGRLAHAFEEMLVALARARSEQQQLVEDAGHELRTPLTSLRTNAALLGRLDELAPSERERLLDDLRTEVEELVTMTNELVALAVGGLAAEPDADVDLGEIAERVAAHARRRTGRVVQVHAAPAIVRGRPLALERAVSNLVDNACKFSETGPVEVTVAGTRVEVRDHGPGIPPDVAASLFDRFSRASAARDHPGSGLGLAIVLDTVTAHGGRVFAHDHPDGGAVVGFDLH